MPDQPTAAPARTHPSWLQVVEGTRPILLIAPHAGRAGPAAAATLHPKVNDLHTAEITRELAATLNASALINFGMDRNRLDCNRVGELASQAAWLLDLIADSVESIIARSGHAWIALIHGWNIIEPRLDFGLGARSTSAELRPVGAAHISASDDFIISTLGDLSHRLTEIGVLPTFGARYPAGGPQNLLQAFTERHRGSDVRALRRLASFAEDRLTDAVQLELSVALRMPGRIRQSTTEVLADSFRRLGHHTDTADAAIAPGTDGSPPRFTIIRHSRPSRPKPPISRQPIAAPSRLGVEFYDPHAHFGAMASFDLGPGAIGARIMLLLGPRRVALFTGEGTPCLEGNRIALGPLALTAERDHLQLTFHGPAIVVPDGVAYLSIEQALASGSIEEAANLAIQFELGAAAPTLNDALAGIRDRDGVGSPITRFGAIDGRVALDGFQSPLAGWGRMGLAMSGLGNARFSSRRTIWACFPDHSELTAIETRLIAGGDRDEASALEYTASGSARLDLDRLDLDARSPEHPPDYISAAFRRSGVLHTMRGAIESFLPLSRPGPDRTRIYTTLGFARFEMDAHPGLGMFEYSRRTEPMRGASVDSSNGEED
jgi:hypothetical protein